jgi:photosystem II stability/assembly factor-like uncharacterized protein
VGEEGTILRTLDAGLTWATVASGTTEDLNDIHFFEDNSGLIVGDRGTILRTVDAGLSWATVAQGITEKLSSVSFAYASTSGIIAGDRQSILRSTDRGLSWIVVQTGLNGEFDATHMATSTAGMVCGIDALLQALTGRTSDGGISWTFHSLLLNGNPGDMNDVYTFDGNVAIGVSDISDGTGAISRTTNGGEDWVNTIFPEGLDGVTFATVAAGFVVGGSGTVLNSVDGGMTWMSQASGTTENLRSVYFLDPLNGYAVGDNGVILKTTTGGVVTSVDSQGETKPGEFHLYQNYPNPFNPGTAIRFSIGKSGPATIKIFDILGREVETLLDEVLGPGMYQRVWSSGPLPSGTYFYKLEAEGSVAVGSMLLLR